MDGGGTREGKALGVATEALLTSTAMVNWIWYRIKVTRRPLLTDPLVTSCPPRYRILPSAASLRAVETTEKKGLKQEGQEPEWLLISRREKVPLRQATHGAQQGLKNELEHPVV